MCTESVKLLNQMQEYGGIENGNGGYGNDNNDNKLWDVSQCMIIMMSSLT